MSRLYMLAIIMALAATALVVLAIRKQGTSAAHPASATTPPKPAETTPAPRTTGDGTLDLIVGEGENIGDADALAKKVAAIEATRPQVEPTTDIVTTCGGPEVLATIQRLHRCAVINGQCDPSKNERIVVDFMSLLRVSTTFRVHAEYFATGVTVISDRTGLYDYVQRELPGTPKDFLVFGAASPTAKRVAVDHEIAGKRALSARNVINDLLTRLQDEGPDIQQANVGRNLSEAYCNALDQASRKTCLGYDEDTRRQVIFVVAYPRVCSQASTPVAR